MSLIARIQVKTLYTVASFLNISEPETLIGEGSRGKVGQWCKDHGYKSALIITGKSGKRNGTIDKMLSSLDKAGVQYVIYDEVKPNPTVGMGVSAAALGKKNGSDIVIAFGGGSPIDCAKLAASAITNKKPAKKLVGTFKVKEPPLPIIAIPTTAGSGSEVSAGSVISDDGTHRKTIMISAKIVPVLAVLDGETMLDLSPEWTATTAFDALTHAVEAYISPQYNKQGKQEATEALLLISKNLKRALDNGKDIEARNALALGAFKAGLALNKCGLGYAHGFGHRMTGYYDMPHGTAVGMFLPHVLDFSRKASEKELAELAVACELGEKNENNQALTDKFIDHIFKLYDYSKLPKKCNDLKKSDYTCIIKEAFKETNSTLPVPKYMTRKEAESFLDRVHP